MVLYQNYVKKIKQNKNLNDETNLAIKSEIIIPFGGFYTFFSEIICMECFFRM